MKLTYPKVTRGNKLIKELKAASCRFYSVSSFDDHTDVECPDDLTGPEQTAIDGVVSAHTTNQTLDEYKLDKIGQIDLRTQQLVDLGFEYPASSGQMFGLSVSSQLLLLGLVVSKDFLPFPVKYNSLDGLSVISLPNVSEVNNFFGTAVAIVKARQDSGTALKDLVRAATSTAEVDAVEDTR